MRKQITMSLLLLAGLTVLSHAAEPANAKVLREQTYGAAPAYDPPKGQYRSTETPGSAAAARNPNPNAYKYTRSYQQATSEQRQRVDSTVQQHQRALDQLRTRGAAAAR
jgi:hypothetical protein